MRIRLAAALAAALFLSAGVAAAGLIFGNCDWDSAGTNRQSDRWFDQLQRQPTGGDPAGWLTLASPAATNEVPRPVWWDMAADAGSLFAGGWKTNMWIDRDAAAPGASEERYLDDLAATDWIGAHIRWDGAGDQTYGIDDFALTVPEPAQFILLGAAMAVSWLSLRIRRRTVPISRNSANLQNGTGETT